MLTTPPTLHSYSLITAANAASVFATLGSALRERPDVARDARWSVRRSIPLTAITAIISLGNRWTWARLGHKVRLLSADGTPNTAQLGNKKAAAPCKEAAALGLISKMKYNDTQPSRLSVQFGWSAACTGVATPAGGAFLLLRLAYRKSH